MYIEELKSADPSDMSFKEIIELYNNNFKLLDDFLESMGNKYTVELFTHSTDRVITFINSYTPNKNNLLVYINGVIQIPDIDYIELSDKSIELTSNRNYHDQIIVIIIKALVKHLEGEGGSCEDLEVREALNKHEFNKTIHHTLKDIEDIVSDLIKPPPIATRESLGVVKIGEGLEIDESGTLSANIKAGGPSYGSSAKVGASFAKVVFGEV